MQKAVALAASDFRSLSPLASASHGFAVGVFPSMLWITLITFAGSDLTSSRDANSRHDSFLASTISFAKIFLAVAHSSLLACDLTSVNLLLAILHFSSSRSSSSVHHAFGSLRLLTGIATFPALVRLSRRPVSRAKTDVMLARPLFAASRSRTSLKSPHRAFLWTGYRGIGPFASPLSSSVRSKTI